MIFSVNTLYSTANSGTPITMPAKPITPPNSRMANMTQKLDNPVALPRIFRSEDIAVKLLQQQHKNDEIQRLTPD